MEYCLVNWIVNYTLADIINCNKPGNRKAIIHIKTNSLGQVFALFFCGLLEFYGQKKRQHNSMLNWYLLALAAAVNFLHFFVSVKLFFLSLCLFAVTSDLLEIFECFMNFIWNKDNAPMPKKKSIEFQSIS